MVYRFEVKEKFILETLAEIQKYFLSFVLTLLIVVVRTLPNKAMSEFITFNTKDFTLRTIPVEMPAPKA